MTVVANNLWTTAATTLLQYRLLCSLHSRSQLLAPAWSREATFFARFGMDCSSTIVVTAKFFSTSPNQPTPLLAGWVGSWVGLGKSKLNQFFDCWKLVKLQPCNVTQGSGSKIICFIVSAPPILIGRCRGETIEIQDRHTECGAIIRSSHC